MIVANLAAMLKISFILIACRMQKLVFRVCKLQDIDYGYHLLPIHTHDSSKNKLSSALSHLCIPVVIGNVLGGGAEVLVACDFALATPDTNINFVQVS